MWSGGRKWCACGDNSIQVNLMAGGGELGFFNMKSKHYAKKTFGCKETHQFIHYVLDGALESFGVKVIFPWNEVF